jgi:hypothetical protein
MDAWATSTCATIAARACAGQLCARIANGWPCRGKDLADRPARIARAALSNANAAARTIHNTIGEQIASTIGPRALPGLDSGTMGRASKTPYRFRLMAGFGGALMGTGVVNIAETGASHHPLLGTTLIAIGFIIAAGGLILGHRISR